MCLSTQQLAAVLAAFFLLSVMWSASAVAHKGHGGSVVKFMQQKDVLKALLPDGAKRFKRKEKLSAAKTRWAENILTMKLDNKAHTYFRAIDRNSGKLLGGAIILKYAYRHGDVILAVGIDAGRKITGVAIQGISEKYIPDFEASFAAGLLPGYTGKTVADLVEMAKTKAADKPTRFFNSKLAETAAMIAALLHDADSL